MPPLKGRHLVVAWIAVFLVTAGIVALRDRAGFAMQKRLDLMAESLQVVARQHSELTADINTMRAPGSLTALGESLGLRVPTDAEIEHVTAPEP